MKGFILGILVTVVVILAVGVFVAETGRVDMRADNPPSQMERRFAGGAMDASVDRNAPNVANPVQGTTDNLVAGAKIYLDHCALCHGDPVRTESPLAKAFNPPPPQFMTDAADMGDKDNYYITMHGVRWTGMPGWKNVLSQREIWEVVTFLARMGNLPPEAKSVFALATPVTAPAPETTKTKAADRPRKKN